MGWRHGGDHGDWSCQIGLGGREGPDSAESEKSTGESPPKTDHGGLRTDGSSERMMADPGLIDDYPTNVQSALRWGFWGDKSAINSRGPNEIIVRVPGLNAEDETAEVL